MSKKLSLSYLFRFSVSPLVSIFFLSLLFSGLRLFEIILNRTELFSNISNLFQIIAFTFTADIVFFFVWNFIYLIIFICAEIFNKDPKYYLRRSFFLLLNVPIIVLFFIDMQTIAVSGNLFELPLLTAFEWRMIPQAFKMIREYYWLVIFFLIPFYLFIRFFPIIKINNLSSTRLSIAINILIWTIVFNYVLSFAISGSHYIPFRSELKYNGLAARTLFRKEVFIACQSLFFTNKKLSSILNNKKITSTHPPNSTNTNVVIFAIESLSQKYVTPESTPFLHSIVEQSAYFKNHFSSTRATSYSVYTILQNFQKFIPESKYINKKFISSFEKEGYSTMFFFGGKKTTFNFHTKIKELGINNFFSKENYLNETGKKQNIDSVGDIMEKSFLIYSANKLNKAKKPFFSLVLTNQPHYPLDCPGTNKKDRNQERFFQCLKYLDDSLKAFFKTIEKEDWFKNTLFVFTGDHIDALNFGNLEQRSYFLQYNVPLIFYHPTKNLASYSDDQISSHVDILPSIVDFLGWSYKYPLPLTHNSVFDLNKKRRVWNYHKFENTYVLLEDKHLLKYTCDTNTSTLYLSNDYNFGHTTPTPVKNRKLKKQYETLLKAYIQYTLHGLKDS